MKESSYVCYWYNFHVSAVFINFNFQRASTPLFVSVLPREIQFFQKRFSSFDRRREEKIRKRLPDHHRFNFLVSKNYFIRHIRRVIKTHIYIYVSLVEEIFRSFIWFTKNPTVFERWLERQILLWIQSINDGQDMGTIETYGVLLDCQITVCNVFILSFNLLFFLFHGAKRW